MAQFDGNKMVDILDTINMLVEYEYITLPPEVEEEINEKIKEIHLLTERIDEIHDNSY